MTDLKASGKCRREEGKYRLMTAKQTGKIQQFSASYKNTMDRRDEKAQSLTCTPETLLISSSAFQQVCHRMVLKAAVQGQILEHFHISF